MSHVAEGKRRGASGRHCRSMVRRVALVVIAACAVVPAGVSGQTPRLPRLVSQASTAPIDVPDAVRQRVADALDYDDDEPIRGIAADVNGDAVRDYLLQSSPRLCGNGGCMYILWDGASGKSIAELVGSLLHIGDARPGAYPTIETISATSADGADLSTFTHDGTAYRRTAILHLDGTALAAAVDRMRGHGGRAR
jgi:hypothetical protein